MLAVSDTSPISNLAFIGRLQLLRAEVPTLWIPTAVERELKQHPDAKARSKIDEAIRDGWIRVGTSQATPLKALLLQQVHQGEAEAISLAADLKAELLLIDESEGRSLAQQAGLRVTGTLGVLLRAKHFGRISAVKPEIDVLRVKARFFLSRLSVTFCAVLAKSSERRNGIRGLA